MPSYVYNDEGENPGDIPVMTTSQEHRLIKSVAGFLASAGTKAIPAFRALVAGDLPPHGAAQHTDRTRRVWLPAKAFIDGLTGTPLYQSTGGVNVTFDNWALDGTADEAVNVVTQMPADWDLGNVTPSIFWAPSDTNTGNVNWIVRITSIAAGEAMNTALESTSGAQTSAASGTQYAITVKNMTTMAAGTGTVSSLLRILVYRFSSDAADTYNAHDALFVGLMLEYTADM